MIFKPLQLKRDTQASQYICYSIIYLVQYDKKQSAQDLTWASFGQVTFVVLSIDWLGQEMKEKQFIRFKLRRAH